MTKTANAFGQRPDGLTTSQHIRAMKREPMRNTETGYQVHHYTQELADKLSRERLKHAKKLRKARNQHFHISEPEPGDTRPRNAFGVLIGFGEAYAAYYAKRDAERTV